MFSILFQTQFFLRVVESTAAISMLAYTVIIVFFNDLGGSEFEKTQIAQETCDCFNVSLQFYKGLCQFVEALSGHKGAQTQSESL